MVYEELLVNGLTVKLDRFLKQKLDIVRKLQEKDFDCMFIIDGQEGTGKSTLSFLCGWYLSKGKLTMNNICEGTSDAITKLENLPDRSVMIIDEGSLLLSSKDTMKTEQRQLIKIFNVIRQKGMILIVVAPSFFDLSKYISVDRSRFLLHVYTNEDYIRGKFTYFSTKKKRMLYVMGKKNFNSYAKPRSDFVGAFPRFNLPFDEEYKKLKRRSLMEALRPQKVLSEKEIRNKMIIDYRKKHPEVPIREIGDIFSLTRRQITNILKKNREEHKEIEEKRE